MTTKSMQRDCTPKILSERGLKEARARPNTATFNREVPTTAPAVYVYGKYG